MKKYTLNIFILLFFLFQFCNSTSAESLTRFVDFSSDGLSPWIHSNHWRISNHNGESFLFHDIYNEVGSSFASLKLDTRSLDGGKTTWEIELTKGNWQFEPNERFIFYLNASSDNLLNADGIAVGFNILRNRSEVEVVRLVNGEARPLISSTKIYWDDDSDFLLKIDRKPNGFYTLMGENISSGEKKEIQFHSKLMNNEYLSYTGVVYNFSASHSGSLGFGNFRVNYERVAPYISRGLKINELDYRIWFSESMDMESLLNVSNYSLSSSKGHPIEISKLETNLKQDQLTITIDPKSGYYPKYVQLLNSILSIDHQTSVKKDTINIVPRDKLVIQLSELMVDPSPAVGLPETEYIELINVSDKPLNANDFFLEIKGKLIQMPNLVVNPDEIFLVVSETSYNKWQEYHYVYPISNFTLSNSGFIVRIISKEGEVKDYLEYQKEQHQNKSKGGWSLEKMDQERICDPDHNWGITVDPKGGTPTKINSVNQVNNDIDPLYILDTRVLADSAFVIMFSEYIANFDKQEWMNLNPHIKDIINDPINNRVLFKWGNPLNTGDSLLVSIPELLDLCGNYTEPTRFFVTSKIASSEDILINEVLFNPFVGGHEFVEIYNNSDHGIDLSQLKFAIRGSDLSISSSQALPCEIGCILHPKQFALLGENLETLSNYYKVDRGAIFVEFSSFPTLPNESGDIVITSFEGNVIDEFIYNQELHNDMLYSNKGVSLERINYNVPTTDENNWSSGSTIEGFATPGYENSNYSEGLETDDELVIENRVFSPNGDGFNDQLIINIFLDTEGWLGEIRFYNMNGQVIHTVDSRALLTKENQFVWDGRDKNGRLVPQGTYLLIAKLWNNQGEKRLYKRGVVLVNKYK